jgi:hypothetical protein
MQPRQTYRSAARRDRLDMVILEMGNINTTKALCFRHCFGPQEVQEPIGEAYLSLKQNGRRGRRSSALAYAKDDYKRLDCGALCCTTLEFDLCGRCNCAWFGAKNGKGRRRFGKEERIRKGRTFATITFLSANNTRAHYQPCFQKRKRNVMSAN